MREGEDAVLRHRLIISPQEMAGSCRPTLRKDREASAEMITPTVMVA